MFSVFCRFRMYKTRVFILNLFKTQHFYIRSTLLYILYGYAVEKFSQLRIISLKTLEKSKHQRVSRIQYYIISKSSVLYFIINCMYCLSTLALLYLFLQEIPTNCSQQSLIIIIYSEIVKTFFPQDQYFMQILLQKA